MLVKKTSQIDWFPDSAARFIELLKVNSWNTAVRKLKAEKSPVSITNDNIDTNDVIEGKSA